MKYYSIRQLSSITGKTTATIRRHIRNGWLKAKRIEGAVGLRVTEATALRWLGIYYPGKMP